MTKFGQKLLNKSGIPTTYIPCFIKNHNKYINLDKLESRKKLNFPTDKFIIGITSLNIYYPDKKAFYYNLKAVSNFIKKYSNTILYFMFV